jgi:hypothetical protein
MEDGLEPIRRTGEAIAAQKNKKKPKPKLDFGFKHLIINLL